MGTARPRAACVANAMQWNPSSTDLRLRRSAVPTSRGTANALGSSPGAFLLWRRSPAIRTINRDCIAVRRKELEALEKVIGKLDKLTAPGDLDGVMKQPLSLKQ